MPLSCSDGALADMPRLAGTIRRTKTQDGIVLLDVHLGQLFSINAVGARILDLLAEGLPEEQIAQELSRIYAVELDVLRSDVREFLRVLAKHQILQTTTPKETL